MLTVLAFYRFYPSPCDEGEVFTCFVVAACDVAAGFSVYVAF
jgi:hypothetical protein